MCGVHTFTREVAVTIGVAGEEHGKNRHRVDLADLYVCVYARKHPYPAAASIYSKRRWRVALYTWSVILLFPEEQLTENGETEDCSPRCPCLVDNYVHCI